MKQLIAYLHGRKDWLPEDIPTGITCLNYAFAKVNGTSVTEDIPNIDRLPEIRHRQPNLKILVSVGGWGADGFSDAVSTDTNRHELVQSTLALIDRYQLDGVDWDWEYPGMDISGIKATPNDSANFTSFLHLLRANFDRRGKGELLTIAIGAVPEALETMKIEGAYAFADSLDWINVMTYDLRGSWDNKTGHQTNLMSYSNAGDNLSVDSAVRELIHHHIPASKIIVGAAAYSRDWSGVRTNSDESPVNRPAATNGTHTTNYQDVATLVAENPDNAYWDAEAQAPFYYDGDFFMSYDDPRSIAAKCHYIISYKLGGLMIWEQSLDSQASLLRAAINAMSVNK